MSHRERPTCAAIWGYDVDFDVTCERPAGHGTLAHRAVVVGNDGVVAVIEWDGPA